jgi:hypothetical protein
VPLPDREGKINEWHRSAGLAAQQAMKGRVRVVANKSLRGYDETVSTFDEEMEIP